MSTTPKRVRKPPKKLVKEVNEPDDDIVGPMFAATDSSPSPSVKPPPAKKHKHKEQDHPIMPAALPVPGVIAKPKKVAAQPVAPPPPAPVIQDLQELLMAHLKNLSGQGQENVAHLTDHNYCRPWNKHPDPNMKCRPAKYLFMKDFPKNAIRTSTINPNSPGGIRIENEIVDVESTDSPPEDPLVREAEKIINMTPISAITSGYHDKPPPSKAGWTTTMHKLWNKSLKILHSHPSFKFGHGWTI